MSSIKIDVGYSPPSSAEVKNDWSCACASTMCPHDVNRDSFIFTFYRSWRIVFTVHKFVCLVMLLNSHCGKYLAVHKQILFMKLQSISYSSVSYSTGDF